MLSRMKTRRDRSLILIAALLHGLTYCLLLPAWMGEDEPWHVEYAHHVSTGHMPWGGIEMHGAARPEDDDRSIMALSQLQVRRRLGGLQAYEISETQEAILDSMKEEDFFRRVDFAPWKGGTENFDQVQDAFTATHQPPLYYMIGAAALKISNATTPIEELYVLRGVAFICYLIVVLFTFLIARLMTEDLWLVALAGFICAWIPMHARQAAVVNNDVLAKVVGGALLFAAARQLTNEKRQLKPSAIASLLVLIAIAFVTKTTVFGCVLCAGLAYVTAPARGDAGKTLAASLACGGVLAVGYGYWRATHSPSLPTSWGQLSERLEQGLSSTSFSELWRTSVGAFNWYSRDLPAGVTTLALTGFSLLLCAALWQLRRPGKNDRGILTLCLLALITQYGLIAMRGVSAGRYLFPVLPAIATLLAVGVTNLGPKFTRRRVVAGVVIAFLAMDAVFLWRGLLVEQYLVWGN